MAFGQLLLLFFFFFFFLPSCLCTSSTIFFNSSLAFDCDASDTTRGYITSIFLANSPFAFGCQTLDDSASYYLTVAFSVANFPSVPVWIANRYRPVVVNASLTLDAGNVVFADVDGSEIWNSSTSTVVGINLTNTGNLILFDHNDFTVWQSFDDPADVLVPGQSLKIGKTLVSGVSSTLFSTGNYTAVMNPGGLVLYENTSSPPLPYYVIRYPFAESNVTEILDSPCNNTVLVVDAKNLTQIQTVMSPDCARDHFQDESPTFDPAIAFVRLEPNGNILGYHSNFEPAFELFNKSSKRKVCGLPSACGRYSICNDTLCRCPSSNFVPANPSPPVSPISQEKIHFGCVPSPRLNCELGVDQQEFINMTGVDYFANDFILPTLIVDTFEQCKSVCALNCSCLAAFYRNNTGECYLHNNVLSIMEVSDMTYVLALKYQKSPGGKSEKNTIIGIITALFVSAVLFGVWLHCHKGKGKRHADEHDLFAALPGQPKRFRYKELRAATDEFSNKLGKGGFGSVYRGNFPDGSKIAVKQLENATHGLKEFRNEVIALSNINHQNLVHLRGFCAEGPHRLLVYEYVPNGSLDAWLFRNASDNQPPTILDWKTRLTIAIHTARAIFFLHEQCRTPIVHLDIKPQNILLDEKFVAKLSDFGLSRLINEDESSAITRMRGTPGYMAPECLILSDATEKSDVYSFGMVLLEVISGRKNVDVSRLALYGDNEGWYFPAMATKKYEEGKVDEIVDMGLGKLGEEEQAEALRMVQAAFWCIQEEPSMRPSMGNVLLMLEGHAPVAPPPPLALQFGMRLQRGVSTSMLPSAINASSANNSPSPPHSPPHNMEETVSSPCTLPLDLKEPSLPNFDEAT